MKKIVGILCIGMCLMIISGCGKTAELSDILPTETISYTQTFIVGNSPLSTTTLYGLVISDSTKNIMTNRGGILDYIDCQPGKEVYKNTVIAKVRPNPDDLTYQNSQIQLNALQNQSNNVESIYDSTQNNFSLQKEILQKQYDNNKNLLENLQRSQDYTSSSLDYQRELLENQSSYLQTAKELDLDKLQTNITIAQKQYVIMSKDALKKIDELFGITNKDKNSAFDSYISNKDTVLRTQVNQQYALLKNRLGLAMSEDEFSTYLLDIADFMTVVAASINASTPSSALPQVSSAGISIDSLYTTFTTLSTTFLTAKSTFDGLLVSYDSVDNSYTNQLTTVETNLENFDENTAESTKLQLENQLLNLQLAQESLDGQIEAMDNTTDIQLTTIENQQITLQQNVAVLQNSLEGEVIYAGIDGIVKMKSVGSENKVAPSTLLCQIVPKTPGNLHIQLFSYQQLAVGTQVLVYDSQKQLLGKGRIVYEYPYKDIATQNYIYELSFTSSTLKENQKLVITIDQPADKGQLWIPLQYVRPRLEGNLVRRKIGETIQEVYVRLGNINDMYVEVLDGLEAGDQIIN